MKYPNFLKCFEMYKEGDLASELAGHHVHDGLLLQGSLVGPKVVKPLKHPCLNITSDLSAKINASLFVKFWELYSLRFKVKAYSPYYKTNLLNMN